jgi:2-dehydropantoate 2-reductase
LRVALMGAGSLGTIIGALVAKNGGDMVLIDANKAHVQAMNEKGARITGKMELVVPVKAILPEEMEGIYDLVIYLVKQTYNKTALQQLLPHLGPDSVVCTLQNGVPEDAVAEIVGRERTVGGTVGWGATWLEPGVSMLTSEPDKMTFDVG